MSDEIKVGDWISFKSSGFKNEGKVTKVEDDSYKVEIPSDGSGVYIDVPKSPKIQKIEAPEGA